MTSWITGPTITYAYDGDGNEMSSSSELSFAYNAKNQTTAITGLFGSPLTSITDATTGQATSGGPGRCLSWSARRRAACRT